MFQDFETVDLLSGLDRFLLHGSVGIMPHAQIMHSIELFGTQVAPVIRKAAADG